MREITPRSPLDQLRGRGGPTLFDLRQVLEGAARDPRVSAVIVRIAGLETGLATADELHALLRALGRAGKRTIALLEGDSAGVREYLVACGAGEIVANPNTLRDDAGRGRGRSLFARRDGQAEGRGANAAMEGVQGRGRDLYARADVARTAREPRSDRRRLQGAAGGANRRGAQPRARTRRRACGQRLPERARGDRGPPHRPRRLLRRPARRVRPRAQGARVRRARPLPAPPCLCAAARPRPAARADSWRRSGGRRRAARGRRFSKRRSGRRSIPSRRQPTRASARSSSGSIHRAARRSVRTWCGAHWARHAQRGKPVVVSMGDVAGLGRLLRRDGRGSDRRRSGHDHRLDRRGLCALQRRQGARGEWAWRWNSSRATR